MKCDIIKRFILLAGTVMLSFLVSCSWQGNFPEMTVPEIVTLESRPDIHSAQLFSSLRKEMSSDVKCGFYIGKDQCIMDKIYCDISGKDFSTTVSGLEEGTLYWFKSFVGNGFNEISTDSKFFKTHSEPDPNVPDIEDPGTGPQPELPDSGPTDPLPEPEPEPEPFPDPEPAPWPDPDPNPGFNIGFTKVKADVRGRVTDFTAILSGQISYITHCTFNYGTAPDDLPGKVDGKLEGNVVTATIDTPSPGVYWFNVTLNGIIKSDAVSFEILKPAEPDPQPPQSFDVTIGPIKSRVEGDWLYLSAEVIGKLPHDVKGEFWLENMDGVILKLVADFSGNTMSAYAISLEEKKYKVKAIVTSGPYVKESEVTTVEII